MVDDDPSVLVGKDMYFRVEVKSAKDLPKELCKDTFVTYELKSEPGRQFRTKNFSGCNQNPNWDYQQLHQICPVTDYYLDWFEKDQVSAPFNRFCLCVTFCRLRSRFGVTQ